LRPGTASRARCALVAPAASASRASSECKRASTSKLQGARKHQKTEAFRESYAARAGIEGTHAQAISRCGLRRCRYIGLTKTRLQHVITAAAINLVRVAEWFAGTPVAKTRRSRLAALQVAA
jgi:transposase